MRGAVPGAGSGCVCGALAAHLALPAQGVVLLHWGKQLETGLLLTGFFIQVVRARRRKLMVQELLGGAGMEGRL